MGRGREEVVVCMEPQMEMSRSVRGHKYHLLRALALFFSATALCVLLRQETRPGVLGRVKEPVFQNREDCDALGFQLQLRQGHSVPQLSRHLAQGWVLLHPAQHQGVFLPSPMNWQLPAFYFYNFCQSWDLQAPHPAGTCKNESHLSPF